MFNIYYSKEYLINKFEKKNMKLDDFKKLNLLLGWICFLISFCVYFSTAEPTVSFWDTGEYITTSSKLQVGHPPGARYIKCLEQYSLFLQLIKRILVL